MSPPLVKFIAPLLVTLMAGLPSTVNVSALIAPALTFAPLVIVPPVIVPRAAAISDRLVMFNALAVMVALVIIAPSINVVDPD